MIPTDTNDTVPLPLPLPSDSDPDFDPEVTSELSALAAKNQAGRQHRSMLLSAQFLLHDCEIPVKDSRGQIAS